MKRRNTGPLRKVVGHVHVEFCGVLVWRERLECGHLVPTRRDIYGPTNAEHRRCRKCQLGIEVTATKEGG